MRKSHIQFGNTVTSFVDEIHTTNGSAIGQPFVPCQRLLNVIFWLHKEHWFHCTIVIVSDMNAIQSTKNVNIGKKCWDIWFCHFVWESHSQNSTQIMKTVHSTRQNRCLLVSWIYSLVQKENVDATIIERNNKLAREILTEIFHWQNLSILHTHWHLLYQWIRCERLKLIVWTSIYLDKLIMNLLLFLNNASQCHFNVLNRFKHNKRITGELIITVVNQMNFRNRST